MIHPNTPKKYKQMNSIAEENKQYMTDIVKISFIIVTHVSPSDNKALNGRSF